MLATEPRVVYVEVDRAGAVLNADERRDAVDAMRAVYRDIHNQEAPAKYLERFIEQVSEFAVKNGVCVSTHGGVLVHERLRVVIYADRITHADAVRLYEQQIKPSLG